MPNKAQVIYSYFKEREGRFFRNDAQKTILLFKGNMFEVSDNPKFNELVAELNLP